MDNNSNDKHNDTVGNFAVTKDGEDDYDENDDDNKS